MTPVVRAGVSAARRAAGRLAATAVALVALASAHAAPQTIDGLGTLDFPTSTKSPDAQTAFVRGLLLLHLYEYPRAEKAFQDAEKLDPGFAMAYWGEAMTATHPVWNHDNPAAARAALARLGATPAVRAAKAGSAREKAWLAAAEALYGPGTLHERDSAFLRAMEGIARDYPDDEAQLFLAQALLGVTRGDRNVDNYLRAAALAQGVLAHNPQHPGAAHYWIHGMDDPEHAAGALPAAQVLAKIAPGAGHAQHMVSHIFIALGMWDDVVAANERTVALLREQALAADKPEIGCGHATDWLQYGYYQQGRVRDAQRQLDNCLAKAPPAVDWMRAHPGAQLVLAKTPDDLQRYLDISRLGMHATMLVETLPHTAVAPLGDAAAGGRMQGYDAFAVGYAAARGGDAARARAQLARLRRIAAQPPDKVELRHLTDYLGIQADLLEAAIAAHDGKQAEALALARGAAARNDALPFQFGPPITLKPPHELVAELLLDARQPQAALAEFDVALRSTPQRATTLLGKARAQKAAGETAGAARTYEQLAMIWKNADGDLAPLAEVRREVRAAR